jgi:pectate lyase
MAAFRTELLTRLGAAAAATLVAAFPAVRGSAEDGPQGFGANAGRGERSAVVRVTTLDDSGPGSLREALSGGDRTIVFDVAGDVVLRSELTVKGPFVTVDGFTAPRPGITLRGHGLDIRGTRGGHDVIVRGLRVRDAHDDGIRVAYGAHNVIIDHVSVHGAGDGSIDITEGARDVTVSWSILARPKDTGERGALPKSEQKNMLISTGAARITLHHNLFVGARQRNPLVYDPVGPAADTTLDLRNNLVWHWGRGVGTVIRDNVRVNVVGNFYGGALGTDRAITIRSGSARVYLADNVLSDGQAFGPRVVGTESQPFPAVPVAVGEPCLEARRIVADAGARPLDVVDRDYVDRIALPECPVTRSR